MRKVIRKLQTLLKSKNKLSLLFLSIRKLAQQVLGGPRYAGWGKGSYIISPIRIIGKKYISFGKDCSVLNGARMEAVTKWNSQEFSPQIRIGNNVNIEQNLHLTCANDVTIEDDVSIYANVLITDINHKYDDVSIATKYADLEVKAVRIGEGTMIGMGARILPGANIGKHCVVGANAVVTRSIPDYSIAVGIPAKVIRKYDFTEEKWVKVQ